MKYELIATATFGLEAVVKREVEGLGCRVIKTEDGKVTFEGDEHMIARANLWLRSADRVLLKMAEFKAETFVELFDQTTALAWERLIPVDGKFTVTCSTVKSKLHNPPAIQSITKKAIVERMKMAYGFERFKETGAEYTVKATLLKDRVTLTVDTSGSGLHKRGYRVAEVDAPIKETLAAALVELSFWHENRILVDPCCGSGTIPIEAALIGKNIAPGLNRKFASQEWHIIGEDVWKEERNAAYRSIRSDQKLHIFAGDISTQAIAAAKKNAEEAGVDDCIRFSRADIKNLNPPEGERSELWDNAVVISNLPYGVRIGDEENLQHIYKQIRRLMKAEPGWSFFTITSDKEMEKVIGRKADRRRKLYNGNIETTYYQFHGMKPKKK